VQRLHNKIYKSQKSWIYPRRTYDHSINPQTIAFNNAMNGIGAAWQALSEEEKGFWNKDANKLVKERVTGFNLFTSNFFPCQ